MQLVGGNPLIPFNNNAVSYLVCSLSFEGEPEVLGVVGSLPLQRQACGIPRKEDGLGLRGEVAVQDCLGQ